MPPAVLLSSIALLGAERLLRLAGAKAQAQAADTASTSTWQVPPDTFINAWRARQGLDSAAAAAAPAVPSNVSEARAWIARWRNKRV